MNMVQGIFDFTPVIVAVNIGQNFFDFVQANVASVVLVGLLFAGVGLIAKKKISEVPGFIGIALLAVALVFETTGVRDFLQGVVQKILGL